MTQTSVEVLHAFVVGAFFYPETNVLCYFVAYLVLPSACKHFTQILFTRKIVLYTIRCSIHEMFLGELHTLLQPPNAMWALPWWLACGMREHLHVMECKRRTRRITLNVAFVSSLEPTLFPHRNAAKEVRVHITRGNPSRMQFYNISPIWSQ